MATTKRAAPKPTPKRTDAHAARRAEPSAAPAAAPAPSASGILALQRLHGNRHLQRLVQQQRAAGPQSTPHPPFAAALPALQRDDTDPKPSDIGWKGKGVKGTSENAKPRLIGKVWRIPIEGLKGVGNQEDATDAHDFLTGAQTNEQAAGRAIVLIPEGLDKKGAIDVLLHLHGHGLGYREFKLGGQNVVRDEAIDQTESQLQAIFESGRNIIAVLPQGTGKSGFGAGFDADAYLKAAFKILGERGDLPKGKEPGNVVFSGHSGGGDTIVPMLGEELAQEKKGKTGEAAGMAPSRLPAKMGELILMDALHGDEDKTLIAFLLARLDHDFKELVGPERMHWPKAHREYLATSFRFRGYHSGGTGNDRDDGKDRRSGYGVRYDNVRKALDHWFDTHKDLLGGEGSIAYQGLRANYQVIDTGRPGTSPGHEKMMGEERLFQDALKPDKPLVELQPLRDPALAAAPANGSPALQRNVTIPADAIPKTRLGDYGGSRTAADFRRAVYQAQLEAYASDATKTFTTGPDEVDLEEVEDGFKMHKAAALDCANLLAVARQNRDERKMFAKYKKPKERTAADRLVIGAGDISIASAHRGMEHDFSAWKDTFNKHYNKTKEQREGMAGGAFGSEAKALMLEKMAFKAIPGYSNHTKGLAVDFKITQNGNDLTANSDQKDAWKASWFYRWLKDEGHGAENHFTQLPSEEWHWDHDPPT